MKSFLNIVRVGATAREASPSQTAFKSRMLFFNHKYVASSSQYIIFSEIFVEIVLLLLQLQNKYDHFCC